MQYDFQTLLPLVEQIKQLANSSNKPVLIAIDGGSGSGKSTIASYLTDQLHATSIQLDSFFRGDIPDQKWDEFDDQTKRQSVFDWNRLRNDVLLPLLNNQQGKWQQLDFE